MAARDEKEKKKNEEGYHFLLVVPSYFAMLRAV